jgi:hypothetical protein
VSPRAPRVPSDLPSDEMFADALRRLRRRAGQAVGGPALAGVLITATPVLGQTGCVTSAEPEVDQTEQAGWVEAEGRRDTRMVSYLGDFWSECRQLNTRFGCGDYVLFLKVRVRPEPTADLDYKRVGVVFKSPLDRVEKTAVGSYHGRLPNGDEEWHVPVSLPNWSRTILFSVWYQDGAHHTYYDDNQGEWHAANDGPAYNVMRVEPWAGTLSLGAGGLRGTISLQLSDLDFDKEVVLVGSTDGWQTHFELGMGSAGERNRWFWAEDYPWSERERWEIDVDLPGDFQRFEYAVVYRHGVVAGARRYEFWDNNGGFNYVVERAAP